MFTVCGTENDNRFNKRLKFDFVRNKFVMTLWKKIIRKYPQN